MFRELSRREREQEAQLSPEFLEAKRRREARKAESEMGALVTTGLPQEAAEGETEGPHDDSGAARDGVIESSDAGEDEFDRLLGKDFPERLIAAGLVAGFDAAEIDEILTDEFMESFAMSCILVGAKPEAIDARMLAHFKQLAAKERLKEERVGNLPPGVLRFEPRKQEPQ